MIGKPPPPRGPLGVYVHFPFCAVRCTYCDFATVAGRDDRVSAYVEALVREIEGDALSRGSEVDSVYFGGGTPSRLAASELGRVLAAVRASHAVASDAEIALEANPESLSPPALEALAGVGVTRISVGVQSLDDEVLRRVRRPHDGARALAAVGEARAAGAFEVGADLILGLPGEKLDRFAETVARVLDHGPDHLSVYLLETDKEAPLARAIRSGRVAGPDDDSLAEAWIAASRRVEAAGFERYEVSNFARPGRRSRHNLKYWTDLPYAGFGLGAHGYQRGERRANLRDLDRYLEAVGRGGSPVERVDTWNPGRRLEEAIVLGLRLREGIVPAEVERRYGAPEDGRLDAVWRRHLEAGVIELERGRVRFTERGTLVANELFADVIGAWCEEATR